MDAELDVSKVTLSTKDNVNLTKQLKDGYKRSAHWNSYYTIPEKVLNNGTKIYELLSASFQGVKKLFVCAYTTAACVTKNEAGIKNKRKYFLPRGAINNYNVLTDGRNFYDQQINDLLKQYDEVRKVSTGKGDNHTAGC